MLTRKRPSNNDRGKVEKKRKQRKKTSTNVNDNDIVVVHDIAGRCDPSKRGIHPDALVFESSSVSGRAVCVSCGNKINKGCPRWGIKYAGNPLPRNENAIPLYGSHPMYMYLHFRPDQCRGGGGGGGGRTGASPCGLAFYRLAASDSDARRTCHACTDVPGTVGELRLLCGGPPDERGKVRSHPFHISCWCKAVLKGGGGGGASVALRDIGSSKCKNNDNNNMITGGLGWNNLTATERALVSKWE